VKNRFWWTTLPVLITLLIVVLSGVFWNEPLPAENGLVQVLIHLFGEPVYLGPVLLGSFLLVVALALALRTKLAWNLFKYGLGLGLLGWVIWQYWSYEGPDGQPMGLITAMDKPINVGPFFLALVILTVAVLITVIRWYVLVRAQGLPFTLVNALRLGLIGYYLSTFLPGSVGGDFFRAAYIAREQSRRTVAVATVLIDRAMGLVGLFWLVALVGGISWVTGALEQMARNHAAVIFLESIVSISMVFVVGSLAFWFLLGFLPQRRADKFAWRLSRIPKIGHSVAEFWRAIWMYRCQGRSVGLSLILSMLGHVGFVLTFYFASLTLSAADQIPSMGEHFLLVPVGMAIQAGCPTPSGVGGGEVGYGELYYQVGYGFDKGVLGSLTQRVLTWILGLVSYLTYLRMRPTLQAAAENAVGEATVGLTPGPSINGPPVVASTATVAASPNKIVKKQSAT
jgi:uncharacterized protein (TIRG00374 family)